VHAPQTLDSSGILHSMSDKECDHTSVGMVIQKDEKILLIERAKRPFGFAIPAGHVDEDREYEKAACRELKEEVGLDATHLELIAEGRKENPCRREGGSWHYWKIYKMQVEGEVLGSPSETKKVGWYSKDEIQALAQRTKEYLQGAISEEEWSANPGLEPIMYEWFEELGILRL